MKILIHAGIHRTGTTSLQGFLAYNREIILRHGISYPGGAANHQPLAWSLMKGRSTAEDVETLINSVGDAETIVLSAEDFCIHTDLRWLDEIAGVHDVRVVFYLRRQDHWIMSWYNQHVKWPFDRQKSRMGKSEFLGSIGDFYWLDYADLLEKWTNVLGAQNVSAAVVEAGQVENVIDDFISRIEIPIKALNVKVTRKNDSLPVHLIEIARNLGLFDLPPNARTRVLRALQLGLAHKADPAKTVYSPSERNQILERFESSNRTVAQRIFGRDSLFLEPAPLADEPFFNFPEISGDELLQEWIAPVIKKLAVRR